MGDPLAIAAWYDNNPVVQGIAGAAYERGVAAGRRQAAENLFETLRAAGVYAVHTPDGRLYQLADVAFAVQTADIAEGAPAEPAPLADRLGDTWASPVTATGFDTEEDTNGR